MNLQQNYSIHCLAVGSVWTMVHTMNQEERVSLAPAILPILVFYLKADGRRILIDTGAPNPLFLSNALKQAKVLPSEIDMVILTHLHFDHCANVALFPMARFVLQRRELEFARHPDPSQRDIYMPELIAEVKQRDLQLVDGDFQVADGVSVHLVPGHTPGQQAVSVATVDGLYVVAGDLFGTFSNINPVIHRFTDLTGKSIPIPILPGQDFYPPGILIDLNDWHASAHKLLAIAGSRERIIPSHEPSLSGQLFPVG